MNSQEGRGQGRGRERGREPEHWTPPTASTMAAAATTPMTAPTERLAGSDVPNLVTVNLAAPAPSELLRFGPGVPVPAMTVDLSKAAAVWRGETQVIEGSGSGDGGGARKRRSRRGISWLLPLLVLIAVLAILLWQHSGSSLTVTDVAVQATSTHLTCDGTASITATMHTNSASGAITYRWRRSDGTVSDTLRQQTAKGSTDVRVVLLWSFRGQGTMNATATLDVLSPGQLSGSTTFVYSCS